MIIEILGAKLLAPYLGTSHFVWTAQITVTLLALSCGYFSGGYFAQRARNIAYLYFFILVASAYLVIMTPFAQTIAFKALSLGLGPATIITSSILFFVPLCLLATSVPYMISWITGTEDSINSSVGKLTAISTIGSLIGTLLISYYLLPVIPNSFSLYGTSAALTLLAVSFFLLSTEKRLHKTFMVILAGFILSYGYTAAAKAVVDNFNIVKLIYNRNSNYGLIQVLEDEPGSIRLLLNDYLIQNQYDLKAHKSLSVFSYVLENLMLSYRPKTESVLCAGMGAGMIPMSLNKKGIAVDIVEINPVIIEAAEKLFEFDSSRFNITVNDARYFYSRTAQRYDAVILDAFNGDSFPAHLLTKEAFEQVKNIMNPDGIVLMNTFGDFDSGDSYFTGSVYRTLKAVFKNVSIHSLKNDYKGVYFCASDGSLNKNFKLVNFKEVHYKQHENVQKIFSSSDAPPTGGTILTDDFNPLEFYTAKKIGSLRKNFVRQIKAL